MQSAATEADKIRERTRGLEITTQQGARTGALQVLVTFQIIQDPALITSLALEAETNIGDIQQHALLLQSHLIVTTVEVEATLQRNALPANSSKGTNLNTVLGTEVVPDKGALVVTTTTLSKKRKSFQDVLTRKW